MSKRITKLNKGDLQMLFDKLEGILDDGGEIILPSVLSVNYTSDKYSKEGGEGYITINETTEGKEYVQKPDSVFLSLLVGSPSK